MLASYPEPSLLALEKTLYLSILPSLLFCLPAAIVWTIKGQERIERAISRGYIFSARYHEDSKPDSVKYIGKTLIEQDRVLRYYQE